MDISFDPAKNARNVAERPFVALGWLDERLHVPCFAPTPGGIRIISFRKANSREERRYERTQQD